ncbi:MAG: UDP-N-acetylmuramoyl-L-alanine--D-glutamate ligase [Spirochaetales bacterium]|nr:UDP-N-acetylmuramoyl-L-alanine--D-glutamate ligase [Spirochaetales bacterium]
MKLNWMPEKIDRLHVLIMGLGLHGGGVESALFFLKKGARVTVTDLNSEIVLRPSIERLKDFPVRFVLGRHEKEDFISADVIIKNPGVPKSSEYLAIATAHSVPVETDLSLFLRMSENPIIAVTGSKGKSSTASAIHFGLSRVFPHSGLGGNITISPLTFIDTIPTGTPVVLELSSWQLADLADKNVLRPKVSLVTNILPDHMNWYDSMEHYIADKKNIYKSQGKDDVILLNNDCPYVDSFVKDAPAPPYFFSSNRLPPHRQGAWLDDNKGFLRIDDTYEQILEQDTFLKGIHNKMNLLSAGLALFLYGIKPEIIREALSTFKGIEHRLEMFLEYEDVSYYNDSAATIPQATVAALQTLSSPVFLITGGTDKNIDFSPLLDVCGRCERIYLIKGSGTEKIVTLFKQNGVMFDGPFPGLDEILDRVMSDVYPGVSVLFSPGCASFGIFLNEFDRGKKFKQNVIKRTSENG